MKRSPLPVVVLISGRGSNLRALIHSQQQQNPPNIEIRAVISNRPDAAGLQFAREQGVPTTVVDHTEFPDRISYDHELIREIDQHQPQLIVLAGFMRILSADFVHHYHGRLLNIHPSLLPRFRGLDTHQQALDTSAREHGASVHYVTEELDGGPVLIQARVPVLDGDDADTLASRVLTEEHKLYPEAIRLIADGRVKMVDDTLLFDQTPMNEPLELGNYS